MTTTSIRNMITFSPIPVVACPVYQDLPTGQLFRYLTPWCIENIYMKTNNPDYCVHLNTGITYTVKPDRQVVSLAPGEQVTISSPKAV